MEAEIYNWFFKQLKRHAIVTPHILREKAMQNVTTILINRDHVHVLLFLYIV